MRKIFFLLIIAIVAVNTTYAQKGWVDYKIDSRLSVKFPIQPKEIQKGSEMAVIKDSIVCLVTVVDFVITAKMDSTKLAPLIPTQKFADELKTGMLAQMQGFTMGPVKIGKWKGHYCYNVEGSSAEQKLNDYTFMVVIGNNMYALSTLVPFGKSIKGKDIFFNSLKFNN